MEKETRTPPSYLTDDDEVDSRRDIVRKLGKYATYAAPFTVLAFSAKADTGSSTGPSARRARKH